MTAADNSSGAADQERLYTGRVRLHFQATIDIGFLLDKSNEGWAAAEALTQARSTAFVADTFLREDNGSLRFGTLADGEREAVQVGDRMDKARDRKGKAIWSQVYLKAESPVVFELRPQLVPTTHQRIEFRPWEQPKLRFFPRGVLAIEYGYEADIDSPRPVVEVIQAIILLRNETRDMAWQHLRDKVLTWPSDTRPMVREVGVKWLPAHSADTKEFVSQHLVHHMVVLLERLPGGVDFETNDEGNPSGLKAGSLSAMAVAGLVNLTVWYDLYSRTYVDQVLTRALRNRNDEIYLTDSHATLIVLAHFWSAEDPLQYYERDILLATLFELTLLTHLRYQAYFMRVVVLDRELRDDYKTRSRRDSLSSVLQMQRILLRSAYEHPAERLIRHNFTRRFLAQLRVERGVDAAAGELKSQIEEVSRAVQLGSGLELEDAAIRVARWTLVLTFVAALIAAVAIVITWKVSTRPTVLTCPDPAPIESIVDGRLQCDASTNQRGSDSEDE